MGETPIIFKKRIIMPLSQASFILNSCTIIIIVLTLVYDIIEYVDFYGYFLLLVSMIFSPLTMPCLDCFILSIVLF